MNAKKSILVSSLFLLAMAVAVTPLYAHGMGPGMAGPAYGGRPDYPPTPQQGWYCPYCGAYQGGGWGMGPGMMGPGWHHGYGMGPEMMGPGYGYGYGPQYQQHKPLEREQAKAIVEDYLKSTRNPNLKLGNIKDEGQYYEAEIRTKDNSLVDMIIVDKDTGWMRSAY